MDDPAESDGPERSGGYEMDECSEQSSLYELAEAGDKKATEGSDDVAARSLS